MERSIYLLLGGGVSTLALLALMAVGALFQIHHLYGALLLFLLSTCLVVGSLFVFALDVRMVMTESGLRARKTAL